jgi:hypothetical protein
MRTYGVQMYSSTILDLGTRLSLVVSFTFRSLYTMYLLHRRLGGSQSRSGRYGVEKNLLPLPRIDPRLSIPLPVAIPTEPPRIV